MLSLAFFTGSLLVKSLDSSVLRSSANSQLRSLGDIREAFFFGSRQLKVAEMDGRAGAKKKT